MAEGLTPPLLRSRDVCRLRWREGGRARRLSPSPRWKKSASTSCKHKPHTFEDLEDTSFDLIITLSPEAHHKALEFTRTLACDVLYWPTIDPTAVEGSRERRLDAYREVRDGLSKRIKALLDFKPMATP